MFGKLRVFRVPSELREQFVVCDIQFSSEHAHLPRDPVLLADKIHDSALDLDVGVSLKLHSPVKIESIYCGNERNDSLVYDIIGAGVFYVNIPERQRNDAHQLKIAHDYIVSQVNIACLAVLAYRLSGIIFSHKDPASFLKAVLYTLSLRVLTDISRTSPLPFGEPFPALQRNASDRLYLCGTVDLTVRKHSDVLQELIYKLLEIYSYDR